MLLRVAAIFLMVAGLAAGASKDEERLQRAATVFSEVMQVSDNAIPQDLLDNAECVAIIPGAKKGAFIFGGKYGRGFVSCRKKDGVGWIGPGALRMEGFNFGLQIGGSETDIIMLVMNQTGARRLMKSRFTIGGDAAAAAGPVGRTVTANTDAFLSAGIVSYSRSRGAFAGIALDGATLREDMDVNKRLYGRRYSNLDLVEFQVDPPPVAEALTSLLNKYSARKGR